MGQTYDARGNLTADGGRTFTYDTLNRLTGAGGLVALAYDPLGRLASSTAGGATTRFQYDGAQRVTEVSAATGVVIHHLGRRPLPLHRPDHHPRRTDQPNCLRWAGSPTGAKE